MERAAPRLLDLEQIMKIEKPGEYGLVDRFNKTYLSKILWEFENLVRIGERGTVKKSENGQYLEILG